MGLSDRISGWRDRLLMDSGFQSWAASFPLTRPVARAKAKSLFELCTGFVYTQVLLACVELDLFGLAADAPFTLQEAIDKTGLPGDGADRLLRAAVSLNLLERRGGERYGLGELGGALLGNPSVLGMIRHHAVLYKDMTDPVALLRHRSTETALAGYWGYPGTDRPDSVPGEAAAAYSDLMARTQDFIASDILHAYSLKSHHSLMDVGGGAGAFVSAAARAAPDLQLTLFDLPAVAKLARERFAAEALGDRAQALGGDMFADDLPSGHDLVTLIRVLHDHDDDKVEGLLASARAALAPGGKLLIAEPMAETPGAEAMGDAYFGMYLWAMGSGRPRSYRELKRMLNDAGFDRVRSVRTRQPLLTRMILAA